VKLFLDQSSSSGKECSGFPEMCTTKYKIKDNNIRFEVLTAVIMKSSDLWNITPCGPLIVRRRFGGNIASICKVEE
jgi:hypothetical protein